MDIHFGWHFSESKHLPNGDNRKLESGRLYVLPDIRPILLCEYGLHFSKSIYDARYYNEGKYCSYVAGFGEIQEDKTGPKAKKIASSHRFILGCINLDEYNLYKVNNDDYDLIVDESAGDKYVNKIKKIMKPQIEKNMAKLSQHLINYQQIGRCYGVNVSLVKKFQQMPPFLKY